MFGFICGTFYTALTFGGFYAAYRIGRATGSKEAAQRPD